MKELAPGTGSHRQMRSPRREFLRNAGAIALAAPWIAAAPADAMQVDVSGADAAPAPAPIRPPRLQPGQTVGIVSPSSATFRPVGLEIVEESLAALGLGMKLGSHVLNRWGYLAGRDADRAGDINALFADPDVDAIFALRGGWGAARLLPLLDFEVIRANPKIFMGYSDITALLVSIYARAGLVTFHGPNAGSWNTFTVEHARPVLFDGEAVTLRNPVYLGDGLAQTADRVRTITPGIARGRLVGGNLTVLTAIVGSDYLPDFTGHILFLEDVDENIYRVDRMLTQLRLAGILDGIAGFVFGKCTECDPGGAGYGSFTLEEVLADHVEPLGVPAWQGSMIGHIGNKFTVPIGVEVEIDAVAGTIRMLEGAVA